MNSLKDLIGKHIITVNTEVKIVFDVFTLSVGQEIEIEAVDEELDRILIQFPNGKIDWKRSYWLKEVTRK